MDEVAHSVYQSYVVSLMSYMHGVEYEKETIFPPDLLGELLPEDIKRWMCLRAFGLEEPGPNDRPVFWRANTLEVAKKAISWYMPNNIAEWDNINKIGNPSKSKPVNNLIKYVKKMEVRRIGKPSSTKRPLTQKELRYILSVFFLRKVTSNFVTDTVQC